MGLGGDSEHTDRQTNRGATGINNIDEGMLTRPFALKESRY